MIRHKDSNAGKLIMMEEKVCEKCVYFSRVSSTSNMICCYLNNKNDRIQNKDYTGCKIWIKDEATNKEKLVTKIEPQEKPLKVYEYTYYQDILPKESYGISKRTEISRFEPKDFIRSVHNAKLYNLEYKIITLKEVVDDVK